MNNSPVNASSDFSIETTELEKLPNVINSPLLASICAAICVFSTIIAFFFGVWTRLIYTIFDSETARSFMYVESEIWGLVDRGIFLNLVVLVTACFAGYLFIGSLNKWIGMIFLLASVLFAALYMVNFLPLILGIDFIPDFFYWSLYGNTLIKDIPILIWLLLSLLILPIIYLIGSIKAKTIPIWKWFVLVIVPFLTSVFGLFPALFLIGINNHGFMYWVSWGMSVWILFTVVIFSELLQKKVSKSYIWLTLILSTGAVVFSVIIISVFSFYIYQRAIEYKKLTTEEMRKTEIAVLLDRTFSIYSKV